MQVREQFCSRRESRLKSRAKPTRQVGKPEERAAQPTLQSRAWQATIASTDRLHTGCLECPSCSLTVSCKSWLSRTRRGSLLKTRWRSAQTFEHRRTCKRYSNIPERILLDELWIAIQGTAYRTLKGVGQEEPPATAGSAALF